MPEGLQQELIDKIFGLDYELGSAFTLFMGEYISQAFGLALAGSSEEQMEEPAINIFEEKFKELEEKDYHETVKLHLEKTDEGWKVSEIDEDSPFLNAVSGGMLNAVKEISESFGESFAE